MELRNQIQQQATQKICFNNFRGIINVAPRVGKSKIVCDAINVLQSPQMILITVPYNSIQESWTTELNKWGVNIPIAIINQRSLAKEEDLNKYDIIICDEIHTLSNAQIQVLQSFDGPISVSYTHLTLPTKRIV